jgi:hypothetical protein
MASSNRRGFLQQSAAIIGAVAGLGVCRPKASSRAMGSDAPAPKQSGRRKAAGVAAVPTDPRVLPTNRALIYGTPEYAAAIGKPSGPIALRPGPHLFIDEYLIEASQHLSRKVVAPRRDPALGNPLVTGKEDRCFQPFFTVSQAAETGRFRIWYGASRDDKNMAGSHLATMESADGIHWQRPTRILDDPGPVQFGSEVLDGGPNCADPRKRYAYSWWYDGGTRIAVSADGFQFTPLSRDVLLRHNHDITNIWRDPLRGHYVATISAYLKLEHMKQDRRTTFQSVSDDLLHWSPPWLALAADDRYDKDVLQFYAMNGYLARGELVIGMVKNLHDDWHAAKCPKGAQGIGSTSLAWTRDGQTWVRDREVFFAPDPTPGAWDHAHAWIDEQVPVGEDVYLYYGGYRWGHKYNRFEDRQIGMVKMPCDRYVAREAGDAAATLRTPAIVLKGSRLTINAKIAGELEVRLVAASADPLEKFGWVRLHGDRLAHPVAFQGKLASLAGQPVRLEFRLRRGQLFGFDLQA